MKKLLQKDKKLREVLKQIENKSFVLKAIYKNFNFFILVRLNSCLRLKNFLKKKSKVLIINKCFLGTKKRFNKITLFSRNIFLKLIRSGYISGLQKSSW